MTLLKGAVGAGRPRVEGPQKLTGSALYAVDYPVEGAAFAQLVQAQVPHGRITAIDDSAARSVAGVLSVIWAANAPRLEKVEHAELQVLQDYHVDYAGQIVAIVVAERLEVAREAAHLVRFEIEREPHKARLDLDDPERYAPEKVNPNFETDTARGNVEAGLAASAARVDAIYCTPAVHNNPVEPHATTARWDGDRLTLWDSNQGATPVQHALASLFGLSTEDVRVISPHVGGGFGSKGTPRPVVVAAAMAARVVGRPVKLAATRQQMFAFVGYRTPTIQRIRLGADGDGRLIALSHDVVEQTSRIEEFAEQTAVASRMIYAAPNRRTTHRLVRVDLPTPSWMRAPGEAPGMYALESAMDELAVQVGVDPIELRRRNEPVIDPDTGLPFSSRNLMACLELGAERFGWAPRDPRPGQRRDGRWLHGTGVAAATYPARSQPSSARATAHGDGSYTVSLAAADIGTGSRTALAQLAADALEIDPDRVSIELGDSRLPSAPLAGGSMGTNSWGWAVIRACTELRTHLGALGATPSCDVAVEISTDDEVKGLDPRYARHAFGAHFVEAAVDLMTGEVRVPRMLGVFAAGRIVNPLTARAQLIGGMTMGLSMALFEESILDADYAEWVNKDLADYHIATYADVGNVEAIWIDEEDVHVNPLGTKGIGEIGIVGVAAAVANALWHATGIRVRDLPIRPDKLVTRLNPTFYG